MAITAFLSRSPGLLNQGPGGPASLGHDPHSSIFSPTDLNFLSPGLYNNLTPTLLPASITILHSIQPLNSQGRPWSDIFDRMHLLFTLVHFFFWQLGLVRGQYATRVWIRECYHWSFCSLEFNPLIKSPNGDVNQLDLLFFLFEAACINCSKRICSNSSQVITFTFRLIPFWESINPFITLTMG